MVQRARRRDAVKEARWRELVAAYKTSDLSVREFCRRERVPENSFYAWRRELTLRDAEGAMAATSKSPAADASWKAGGLKSRSSAQRPTFVPVTLAGPVGAPLVEVALAHGAVLRVHAGCDAATLAMVLAALEGSRC
jgi:hypothetical protein